MAGDRLASSTCGLLAESPRVCIAIAFQRLLGAVFFFLGNQVKAPLAQELKKQSSRITGPKVEDMVGQRDKGQAVCLRRADQVCLDSLSMQDEKPFYILDISQEDML
jgi:hypothetical protein